VLLHILQTSNSKSEKVMTQLEQVISDITAIPKTNYEKQIQKKYGFSRVDSDPRAE
jgi:hypothetical protein